MYRKLHIIVSWLVLVSLSVLIGQLILINKQRNYSFEVTDFKPSKLIESIGSRNVYLKNLVSLGLLEKETLYSQEGWMYRPDRLDQHNLSARLMYLIEKELRGSKDSRDQLITYWNFGNKVVLKASTNGAFNFPEVIERVLQKYSDLEEMHWHEVHVAQISARIRAAINLNLRSLEFAYCREIKSNEICGRSMPKFSLADTCLGAGRCLNDKDHSREYLNNQFEFILKMADTTMQKRYVAQINKLIDADIALREIYSHFPFSKPTLVVKNFKDSTISLRISLLALSVLMGSFIAALFSYVFHVSD